MNKLTLDISGKCNLNCKFCYQTEQYQMNREKVLGIIDSNPDFDTIEIGGGEPMIYEGITGLSKEITRRGRRLNISTNGTFISKEFLSLEEVVRRSIEVQVSLHASNAELYQRITGQNLFREVVSNILELRKKYSTGISSSIYSENFDDVPELLNIAEKMSLPIRMNLVFPIGNGKNVKLLDEFQIDKLRGILLAKRVFNHEINSPLVHENNCDAMEVFYGIPKVNSCPMLSGAKKYFSPSGNEFGCEFCNGKIGGENGNDY